MSRQILIISVMALCLSCNANMETEIEGNTDIHFGPGPEPTE